MTTYIAQFTAKHKLIQVEQNSIFTWQQEGGEIDEKLLADKIKRESALLFFRILVGDEYPIPEDDVEITIGKTMPFNG